MSLLQALCDALPERAKKIEGWEIREYPLFAAADWCGIEITTPQCVLHPEEKAALREIFANHVSASNWMFGYNELRFTDYVNRDARYAR